MMIGGCTGKICLRLALCVVLVINMLYPQTAMEFGLVKLKTPDSGAIIVGDFGIINLETALKQLDIDGVGVLKITSSENGY